MSEKALLFVLDAQMPFVRHLDTPGRAEEAQLFAVLSDTWLPLLRSCTAMEADGVPFRFTLSISPTLCEMLDDPLLQERYIAYLDKNIEFGLSELDRHAGSPEEREVIKYHLDRFQADRRDFSETYNRNILGKIDYFALRGHIEILATTATALFMPLYSDIPEALNAQIETGLTTYRRHFTTAPSGFWLPAMAWFPGCEAILRSYGYQYTFVDGHALLFADPIPGTGVYAPVACENGFAVFGRDTITCRKITGGNDAAGYYQSSNYLDMDRDIGYELDEATLSGLFDVRLGRRHTGFRYWCRKTSDGENSAVYRLDRAYAQIDSDSSEFIEHSAELLTRASEIREGEPVSLVCALSAHFLGQQWQEGVSWFEASMRKAVADPRISLALPGTSVGDRHSLARTQPRFSSWHAGGYAEEVLNSSNDWIYRFVRKATLRMIDLAERFPDDTGLKERALNMAARELLLSQSMHWPLLMNESDRSEYAKKRFEDSVRAFTVVYESLGSNFISTEWLTTTEKRDNLFPDINYRVFSRKK